MTLTALAALAALGLAGCNKATRAGAASGICKPFTTASAQAASTNAVSPTSVLPPAPADPSAGLDDCLHRWGYTLAASSDPANFVAAATLAACSQPLANWNQQALGAAGPSGAIQAPSLMTGEATNPLAEHHAFAEGRALFYVVQARAGHCAPPPASNSAAAAR